MKSCLRVGEMLGKICSLVKAQWWVWEVCANYHERVGSGDAKVLDCLQKCHRVVMGECWGREGVGGGEEEDLIEKLCSVTLSICEIHERAKGEKERAEGKVKAKYMVRSVVKRMKVEFEFRGGEEAYGVNGRMLVEKEKEYE